MPSVAVQVLAASLQAPSAAPALPSLPAAAVPVSAPSAVPSAAAASLPAAHPRDWQFHTWSHPPKEATPGWKFRDLPFFSAKLFDGSRAAEPLGAGAMGSVFAHPTRPDAVVKIARSGYADAAGQAMAPDDETVLAYEDYDLDRLAALGAAPRTLARVEVSGRPGSVRERVYGRTVASLKRAGAFGPREKELVQGLLTRIAEGGFVARDMNLGNILIGRRAGDAEDRAYLVDALGVFEGKGDAAARRAEMLAEPVPWLAWNGFGLARPLSRMLESAPHGAKGFGTEDAPVAWPRWKRWAVLGGILGTMAVAPPLVHAANFSVSLGLGAMPSWGALAASAAVLGTAGIPLRLFAHRLAPWVMRRSKDQGAELMRQTPLLALPQLAVGAAAEEYLFRGIVFLGLAALLHLFLPALASLAAASFGSSLLFALIHGYGSVWTRVVGGMLYAGAFMVTGTLALPIAAHFAFNLSLYLHGRYLKRA